jgi:hypothetical protein
MVAAASVSRQLRTRSVALGDRSSRSGQQRTREAEHETDRFVEQLHVTRSVIAGRGDPQTRASVRAAFVSDERGYQAGTQDPKEVTMATVDIWTYRVQEMNSSNLVGYEVEALDGSIGKIDEASNDVGASYVVVDTGPWIFGKKVMLPAGTIKMVDPNEEKVMVNRTKDQIKNSPEFDPDTYRDDTYRGEIGTYYGPGGTGWRDW